MIQVENWKLVLLLVLAMVIVFVIVSVYDIEKPREANPTILEQQREKWRNDKEESISNGSSDKTES